MWRGCSETCPSDCRYSSLTCRSNDRLLISQHPARSQDRMRVCVSANIVLHIPQHNRLSRSCSPHSTARYPRTAHPRGIRYPSAAHPTAPNAFSVRHQLVRVHTSSNTSSDTNARTSPLAFRQWICADLRQQGQGLSPRHTLRTDGGGM
eukprot:1505387-Rhodomonas_salina.2